MTHQNVMHIEYTRAFAKTFEFKLRKAQTLLHFIVMSVAQLPPDSKFCLITVKTNVF